MLRYWLPAGLYAGLLFWLSSLQSDELPSLPLWDKLQHLLAYAGMGFLFVRAFRPVVRHWSVWLILGVAAGGALLYGVTDECHQRFVQTRSPESGDLLADGLGGFVGGVVFLGYLYVRKRYGSVRSGDSAC